jgi:uncharacterized protein YvpB
MGKSCQRNQCWWKRGKKLCLILVELEGVWESLVPMMMAKTFSKKKKKKKKKKAKKRKRKKAYNRHSTAIIDYQIKPYRPK